MICWENFMPLARYHQYAQGEQIHIAATADDSPDLAEPDDHDRGGGPRLRHFSLSVLCSSAVPRPSATWAGFAPRMM